MLRMAIKESLEAFLAHVECMKDEDQYGDDGYTREFQCLKQRSVQYRVEGTFPALEGEKELNRKKNRYKDIIPFDYTRVILKDGHPGDYINANFIKGANGQPAYIASQGPLLSTVIDFWRMLWEYSVHIVIMACNEHEGDKLKCARYWPEVGEQKIYGDVKVTHQSEDTTTYLHFVVRILEAELGDVRRTLYQFHYIGWPDHGIPSIPSLLDLISLVRDHQPSHTPSIVVHCSAGCGRTGTICAIDYAWSILKLGNLTQEFNLFEIIGEMRKQRPAIVQAKDQYIAVHHAVQELFKRHLSMIQNHSYQNVDRDGNPILIDNIENMNPHRTNNESDSHEYEFVDQPRSPADRDYANTNDSETHLPEVTPQDIISVYEEVSPVQHAVYEEVSPAQRAVKDTITNLINTQHLPVDQQDSPIHKNTLPPPRPAARRLSADMKHRSWSQGSFSEPPHTADITFQSGTFLSPDPNVLSYENLRRDHHFENASNEHCLKLQKPPMKPRRRSQIKKSASEGDHPTDEVQVTNISYHEEGTLKAPPSEQSAVELNELTDAPVPVSAPNINVEFADEIDYSSDSRTLTKDGTDTPAESVADQQTRPKLKAQSEVIEAIDVIDNPLYNPLFSPASTGLDSSQSDSAFEDAEVEEIKYTEVECTPIPHAMSKSYTEESRSELKVAPSVSQTATQPRPIGPRTHSLSAYSKVIAPAPSSTPPEYETVGPAEPKTKTPQSPRLDSKTLRGTSSSSTASVEMRTSSPSHSTAPRHRCAHHSVIEARASPPLSLEHHAACPVQYAVYAEPRVVPIPKKRNSHRVSHEGSPKQDNHLYSEIAIPDMPMHYSFHEAASPYACVYDHRHFATMIDRPTKKEVGVPPVAPPRRKHGRQHSRGSNNSDDYEPVRRIAYSYHEDWDGRGGLAEDVLYTVVDKRGFHEGSRAPFGFRKQSDNEAPEVPPKNLFPRESDSDRSNESIESSPKDGMLALGRKIKDMVSQTFTMNAPANAPTQGHESQKTQHGAVFFKGNDISFPQRLRKPQGPRKVKLASRDSSGMSTPPQPKGKL